MLGVTCCCDRMRFQIFRVLFGRNGAWWSGAESWRPHALYQTDVCENAAELRGNVFRLPDRPKFHPPPGPQLQAETYERQLCVFNLPPPPHDLIHAAGRWSYPRQEEIHLQLGYPSAETRPDSKPKRHWAKRVLLGLVLCSSEPSLGLEGVGVGENILVIGHTVVAEVEQRLWGDDGEFKVKRMNPVRCSVRSQTGLLTTTQQLHIFVSPF